MKKFIIKNSRLVAEKNASISIRERGFLFGDGMFETCKVINGKILDFNLHQARICKALETLKFSLDTKNLEQNCYKLIKKNSLSDGILKILISRGRGSRGYLPTSESRPLVIIETSENRALPQKISLGISKIVTPGNAFKSMSAMAYVMAKIEAEEQGVFDCVMLSSDGFVAETSSANIFWVKNDQIYTPDESCGMVQGCARERVLKSSKIEIKKVRAKISDLENADEIFLTNSAFLVIPVDEFLGKKLQTKWSKKLAC
jgi:aminodeoxychorismate lyase